MIQMTAPMTEAADILNAQLNGHKDASISDEKKLWATQYLQHEWLKAAARRSSNSNYVEAFMDALEAYSPHLLTKVINMADLNVISFFFSLSVFFLSLRNLTLTVTQNGCRHRMSTVT